MNYLVYADGACSGNGRKDAVAEGSFAVYAIGEIKNVDQALHDHLINEKPYHHEARFSVFTNGRGTNNIAEARTLQAALIWLVKRGLFQPENHIHLCMDSQLVLSQFKGLYKVRNPQLRKVYDEIYDVLRKESLLKGFDVDGHIHLNWIPGDVMKASVIAH